MTDNTERKAIVLNTSDDAAKLVTVTGWVSRDGRFYGDDERLARWAGCTHLVCECGEMMDKGYTKCLKCRVKSDHERWLKLPLVEWDGVTPLTIFGDDTYFFDVESIYEHAEEAGCAVSALELVVCEPCFAREVDEDYWQDDLAEDGELPLEIRKALLKFNEVVRAYRQPLSWHQGKERVVLPDAQSDEQICGSAAADGEGAGVPPSVARSGAATEGPPPIPGERP